MTESLDSVVDISHPSESRSSALPTHSTACFAHILAKPRAANMGLVVLLLASSCTISVFSRLITSTTPTSPSGYLDSQNRAVRVNTAVHGSWNAGLHSKTKLAARHVLLYFVRALSMSKSSIHPFSWIRYMLYRKIQSSPQGSLLESKH